MDNISHYFTKNKDLPSDPHQLTFNYQGKNLKLTSDHGTFSKNHIDYGTQLLLQNIKQEDLKGKVLDVGCGYGVIGLALATDPHVTSVEMVDVNDRAVALSQSNAQANQITKVFIHESDGYEAVNDQFNLIVTNPPIRAGKTIVHQILSGAYDFLVAGGCLYVVIRKQQGAPSALALLKSVFEEVDIIKKSKGYYILYARKTLQ